MRQLPEGSWIVLGPALGGLIWIVLGFAAWALGLFALFEAWWGMLS